MTAQYVDATQPRTPHELRGIEEKPVMRIDIRRVLNGVVLRVEPEQEGEEPGQCVYQETEPDEIDAFAEFLRTVLDYYGPTTSRHSPKRIHVVVEPGDKYEPPDEGERTR